MRCPLCASGCRPLQAALRRPCLGPRTAFLGEEALYAISWMLQASGTWMGGPRRRRRLALSLLLASFFFATNSFLSSTSLSQPWEVVGRPAAPAGRERRRWRESTRRTRETGLIGRRLPSQQFSRRPSPSPPTWFWTRSEAVLSCRWQRLRRLTFELRRWRSTTTPWRAPGLITPRPCRVQKRTFRSHFVDALATEPC